MFKRIVLIPPIVAALFLLASSPVVAQSQQDAIRLHKEANALREKANSNEELEKAVKKFEEALTIYRKVGDSKNAGLAYNDLGIIYAGWGEYQTALEYFERSLAIARDLKNRPGSVNPLTNLGEVFRLRGKYEKAVQYFEESLILCRELNNRNTERVTLNALGMVYRDWGEHKEAMEYFEKSRALARELKDRRGELNPLAQLGWFHRNRGEYAKAVENYERSLAICRELKYRAGEVDPLNLLGQIYREWGQYDKAVDYLDKSLALAREFKNRKSESNTLMDLGAVYKDWGRSDAAIAILEESLAMKRQLKDRRGEGQSHMNIGIVLLDRGEPDKALGHFQKCLAIWNDIGVPTKWPTALIGETCMDLGDLDKAESYIAEGRHHSSWGRFYLLKANYNNAKDYYNRFFEFAEKTRNTNSLFTAYIGLGAACEGVKDYVEAAKYYEMALKHTEGLRTSLSAAEREKFLEVRINGFYRTAPYEGLARVQLRLNNPAKAWHASEYTKARLFAEAMSRRSEASKLDVPADVQKTDQEIIDQLAALKKQRQAAYEKDNKDQISALELQVKQLEEEFAAHKKMLREKYPLFAATKYPEPMDLSQTALKADEWALAYDVTDPGLIVYLTKGKELKKALFKPVPRKDVDALVKRFRQPFEDVTAQNTAQKLRAFDFVAGKQLADLLLSDVLPEIPKGTPLIIVPDDSLGAVPFEMLVLNQGGSIADNKGRPNTTGAEFLGDRNLISYYQSITALTLARNFGKQKGAEAKRLVMSDPIFDAQDQRLKDLAAQKKQTLMKALPQQLMSIKQENKLEFLRLPATGDLGRALKDMDPAHTELCMGMEASKPALFKKPLDKYGSVVFATHGYFGKELAGIQEPVLVLTLLEQPKDQDGFLRLSEVMGLKLNADIVALTACQTGLGRLISGEGTMGMGRAFQYAGAKSVLMSLWSVSEASSVKLVESFFKNLKEGKSKLEALKLARDEIRKAGYDHPFYWAPFILVGEVN